MNKFEKAVKNSQLLDFALGRKDYFIHDREYGEHSVIQSYTKFILPLLAKNTPKINESINEMFKELSSTSSVDKTIKYEFLLNHLHVYYYLRKEGKISNDDALKSLDKSICEKLNRYVQATKNDKSLAYFSPSIKTIIKNGGLKHYNQKKNEKPVELFSDPNNFSLFRNNEDYIISVFNSQNSDKLDFKLLPSEVPDDFSRLSPLADDMRNDTRSYLSRKIEGFNSTQEE